MILRNALWSPGFYLWACVPEENRANVHQQASISVSSGCSEMQFWNLFWLKLIKIRWNREFSRSPRTAEQQESTPCHQQLSVASQFSIFACLFGLRTAAIYVCQSSWTGISDFQYPSNPTTTSPCSGHPAKPLFQTVQTRKQQFRGNKGELYCDFFSTFIFHRKNWYSNRVARKTWIFIDFLLVFLTAQ